MTLDITTTNPLSGSGNDSVARPALPHMSCGASLSARWHCAVTDPIREHLASCELRAAGWTVYLPLHFEPGAKPYRNRIVPLFPRYLFVSFEDADPWGAISRTCGVVSLITHGIGQPTPLPHGVVEDLIARTSERGVVDDMPDAGAEKPVQAGRGVWRNIGTLSADERLAVLHRLFSGDTLAA